LLATEELADRVWSAAIGKVGADALAAIALEYRAYASTFPGRTASLAAADRDDPDVAVRMNHLHEPLAATFRSFGLDEPQTRSAHQIGDGRADNLSAVDGAGHRAGHPRSEAHQLDGSADGAAVGRDIALVEAIPETGDGLRVDRPVGEFHRELVGLTDVAHVDETLGGDRVAPQ